jgi:hypothetical protein
MVMYKYGTKCSVLCCDRGFTPNRYSTTAIESCLIVLHTKPVSERHENDSVNHGTLKPDKCFFACGAVPCCSVSVRALCFVAVLCYAMQVTGDRRCC